MLIGTRAVLTHAPSVLAHASAGTSQGIYHGSR